jgi:uncharacterized protein YggU (UPF0235/DUF167 family)|tara:strand:- start:61 stop:876 length:816 start_codon:yes stop_codon:yes gene_type:complete
MLLKTPISGTLGRAPLAAAAMPKRATQAFSSEDAPDANDAKIGVYYCRYTGEHVLITDAELAKLPKRKTDSARVLDTEKYTVRLKAVSDGKATMLRREGGKVERQYRYMCGDLPVCYKSEEEGRYLYIIDGALSAFKSGGGSKKAGKASVDDEPGAPPVPPCIQQTSRGITQVAVEVEDRARLTAVMDISADEVTVGVTGKAHEAGNELVEFFAKVLVLRVSQMSLTRGWSTKSKLVMIRDLTPRQVYDRLRESMEENIAKAERVGGVGRT